jgi:hypothetical protein
MSQERGQFVFEKLDGLSLELALPFLIDIEDRPRGCAEGAVVEKDDVGVEKEMVT